MFDNLLQYALSRVTAPIDIAPVASSGVRRRVFGMQNTGNAGGRGRGAARGRGRGRGHAHAAAATTRSGRRDREELSASARRGDRRHQASKASSNGETEKNAAAATLQQAKGCAEPGCSRPGPSGNAHSCPFCRKPMHAFCGTAGGEEGYGQPRVCTPCARKHETGAADPGIAIRVPIEAEPEASSPNQASLLDAEGPTGRSADEGRMSGSEEDLDRTGVAGSQGEVELTQSPEPHATRRGCAVVAARRAGRGGRTPVDDGIIPPDTSTLSPDSATAAMREFKKAKSRAASKRFRERTKEAQSLLDSEECAIVYRTLADMQIDGDAVTSFRRGLEEGSTFATKDLLKHRIREVAEYVGVYDLLFDSNTSSKIDAFSNGLVARDSFRYTARVRTKGGKQEWEVSKSLCTNGVFNRQRQRPGTGDPKTAYRERDVAAMLQGALQAEPHLSASACRSLLKPYLRFAELLTDNMVARSRTAALHSVYGDCASNMRMLPALQAEMESRGHSLTYTTFGGREMRDVILSVAKAEYVRRAKEARRVAVGERTIEQQEALRPWNTHGRTEFVESRTELLQEVEKPGKEYVDCIIVSFSHTAEGREKNLLRLVNADAAHGKLLLDMYNIFCVVGFTSNMEIVPLLYVFVTGNESKTTWTKVMQEVSDRYPGIGTNVTFTTDQDKGATAAVASVFQDENPVHLICHHHRVANLARHGRRVTDAFKRLAFLPTLAQVNAFRASAFWRALPASGRDAISNVPDDRQLLGVAAERGAVTYGKSSSQSVESQNSHILKARCLDVFSAVLELCRLEKVRYEARYAKAHTYSGAITPWAREKLDKLTCLPGTCEIVAPGTSPDTTSESGTGQLGSGSGVALKVYRFISGAAGAASTRSSTAAVNGASLRERTYVVQLVECNPAYFAECSDDDDGDDCDDESWGSMFETPLGVTPKCTASCTCGVPQRDRFPCSHMFTAAVSNCLPVERLVPPEFRVSHWRSQFPATTLHFSVPTREDVVSRHKAESTPSSNDGSGSVVTLLAPVTAPPKRGRPNLRRRRSAIEKVSRRVRQS